MPSISRSCCVVREGNFVEIFLLPLALNPHPLSPQGFKLLVLVSSSFFFFFFPSDKQGFQFIVDDSGGFSGVATEFLENIADEYPNTPVLLYAVRGTTSEINPRSRKQKIARNLHDSVSFSRLSSFCKLIVPLGLPFLSTSKHYFIC